MKRVPSTSLGPDTEFERDLLSRIASHDSDRRRAAKRVAWLVCGLGLPLLLSAFLSAGAAWFTIGGTALPSAALTLIEGLRTNNAELALSVCAEGAGSAQCLAKEQARVFGVAPDEPETDRLQRRESRLTQLGLLRSQLEKQGVSWDAVTPLAIGGIHGRVYDRESMREPVDAFLGTVYFSSRENVFAIEISAWRCGRRFVIVDIWQWQALHIAPSEVPAHAAGSARQVDGSGDNEQAPPELSGIRRAYITL